MRGPLCLPHVSSNVAAKLKTSSYLQPNRTLKDVSKTGCDINMKPPWIIIKEQTFNNFQSQWNKMVTPTSCFECFSWYMSDTRDGGAGQLEAVLGPVYQVKSRSRGAAPKHFSIQRVTVVGEVDQWRVSWWLRSDRHPWPVLFFGLRFLQQLNKHWKAFLEQHTRVTVKVAVWPKDAKQESFLMLYDTSGRTLSNG